MVSCPLRVRLDTLCDADAQDIRFGPAPNDADAGRFHERLEPCRPEPVLESGSSRGVDYGLLKRFWKPLSLHYSLVVLRSLVQVGMAQFLTLYLYTERGFSFQQASLGLTVFFLSAATGSFLGGSLSDHIGGRRVVLISMIAAAPFLFLFVQTTGPQKTPATPQAKPIIRALTVAPCEGTSS